MKEKYKKLLWKIMAVLVMLFMVLAGFSVIFAS
jgi:hypothetical protein